MCEGMELEDMELEGIELSDMELSIESSDPLQLAKARVAAIIVVPVSRNLRMGIMSLGRYE